MLHIIEEGKRNLSGFGMSHIIEHRWLPCAEENKRDISELGQMDAFDGKGTFYLVYTHKRYGLVGSSRLVNVQRLLRSPFPFESSKIRRGYALMDCVFYMREGHDLFKGEDEAILSVYECLFEDFYSSVTQYLEHFFIEHGESPLFFCLTEEALDCLQAQTKRRYKALGSMECFDGYDEHLYWGKISMQDLMSKEAGP